MIDLTGQVFERLTVLERDYSRKGGTYWKCQCECGNIKSVTSAALRDGRQISCGCYRKEKKNLDELIGKTFGNLTVLKRDLSKETKHSYWVC